MHVVLKHNIIQCTPEVASRELECGIVIASRGHEEHREDDRGL